MQKGHENIKAAKNNGNFEDVMGCKSELYLQRNNIREILLCSNATPIRRYMGIGYTCCYCDEQYPQAAQLKQHTLDSHTDVYQANFMKSMSIYEFVIKLDITHLRCTVCDTHMDSYNELINHLIEVHKKIIYTKIKKRILPIKFNNDVLQCDICGTEFNRLKFLITHMNTHYRNYICKVCDAGFITYGAYKLHLAIHSAGEFQCHHCSKVFNTSYKMIYHERRVHSNSLRPNKCGYCPEYFKDYHKKITHLYEIHGICPKTFSCLACDKSFTSQKLLSLHTNRDHLMLRPHKCTECDKSFFRKKHLINHMIKHSGERNFQCDVCHKCYGMKKTLIMHMRIHMNDRRYKCEHCGQAFVQKCSWRGHLRNKHGVYI